MSHTRFVMIGGFLGAGKTTTVARLARHYINQGLSVGIVTNDQTTDLVDTNSLRAQGYNVGEVAGSCFCCNFNELTATVERIGRDKRPDVILAEPVGSCTDLVATVIRPLVQVYQAPIEVAPYGVILKPSHGARILRNEANAGFSPKAAYIFRKQIEEADFVMLNRIDELDPAAVQELTELLEREYPGRPVLRVSAKTGEGFSALCNFLDQRGNFGRRVMDVDYDIYAEGEAELGWLNANLRVSATAAFALDDLLLDIIRRLQESLAQAGAETAHLKTIGLWEGFYGVANLVSSFTAPELSLPSNCRVRQAQLVVNARVAIDPADLERLVRLAVTDASTALGAAAEIATVQSFRPGRPVPTHRIFDPGNSTDFTGVVDAANAPAPEFPKPCNEYFDFIGARSKLDDSAQLFEYAFLVKKPLPAQYLIFEHFSTASIFHPTGEYPLVPTNKWRPGLYIHRTRQYIPAGEFDWWIGMLDETTGQRLPIVGTNGDDRVNLGRIVFGPLDVAKAAAAARPDRDLPIHLNRCRLPVYFAADGSLVSQPEQGFNPNRAAVLSIPKAGTYLLEALLRDFGFKNCGLHLSLAHCEDYRDATMEDMFDVRVLLRAQRTTQLVARGQSIVGHVVHCLESRSALHDFRKMFVCRNLRDAVVSLLRFSIKNNHPVVAEADLNAPTISDAERCARFLEAKAPQVLAEYVAVLGWQKEPGVLSMTFEDLMGDNGPEKQAACILAIARHVEVPLDRRDVPEVLGRHIGRETLTFSGQRTNWRRYWNDDVEKLFIRSGIRDAHRQLGYSDAADGPAVREPVHRQSASG